MFNKNLNNMICYQHLNPVGIVKKMCTDQIQQKLKIIMPVSAKIARVHDIK